ncbi:hypothetical protein B0H16DRAFT_945799, partial [Mycena metata]
PPSLPSYLKVVNLAINPTSKCSHCGPSIPASSPVPLAAKEPYDWGWGATGNRLLNSNEPPHESETLSFKTALSEVDSHLSSLEDEILRFRDRLKQLKEHHAELSAMRALGAAVFSPLRRIPSEVLCEIFSWTVPTIADIAFCKVRLTDSPWVLTHICRRWRTIAIADPLLWSLVAIAYSENIDPSSQFSLPLIKTQLERVRNLRIYFAGCEVSDSRPAVSDSSTCGRDIQVPRRTFSGLGRTRHRADFAPRSCPSQSTGSFRVTAPSVA